MKVPVYSSKGKKLTKGIELDDTVFGCKPNAGLMAQAVNVHLTNKRQGTRAAKARGEVSGGGVKPWAQKYPDRARHGSTRSPIWKGGGVVKVIKPKNYRKSLPKKMRRLAICSAWSVKAKEEAILVLEEFESKDKKGLTSQAAKLLDALKCDKKCAILKSGKNEDLSLAFRNVPNINLVDVSEVGVFDILKASKWILLKDTLEEISQRWGAKRGNEAEKRSSKAQQESVVSKKSAKKIKPKKSGEKSTTKKVASRKS